jgi:hypothetical protein
VQNPFAETGAASSFKNRIENHSNGVTDLPGVDHIGQLTPFQNQVLDAAERKEAEEQKKRQEEAKNGGGNNGPPRNARAQSGQGGNDMDQEETVRYINKDLNPDHEVH